MRPASRPNLLGLRVHDSDGEEIGRVVDTWPDDGGWETVMVVVRLMRFGERRMLPLDSVVAWGGVLRVSYSRLQIEDAPEATLGVYRADDPWRAIAYWRTEEPARAAILTPQWRRSSGFYDMERPSPMLPRLTRSAR